MKASDAYKNYILIGRGMDNEIFEFSPKLSETKVNFDTLKPRKFLIILQNWANTAALIIWKVWIWQMLIQRIIIWQ